MKKGTSFFYIFIAILGITFFSCKLKVEEESLYDKPGVNVTANQVTVIIPNINTDTKYINVYRRDKQNDEQVNIGIMYYPYALENDNKNFCYIDTLVTAGHSYQYKVRYCINGEYYYTDWSDAITIQASYNCYAESTNLKYQTSGGYIVFESTDSTITFNGTVTAPDFPEFSTEGYKPMLIIKSSSQTQAFAISAEAITNHTAIELIGLLPQSFLDTDITIEGIVGQKTNYVDPSDTNSGIKSVIWTEPASITVQGAGSDCIINIAPETGSDGFDYSRRIQ